MSESPNFQDFDRLVERYCDQQLSPAEQQQLVELLRNETYRARYLAHIYLHATLSLSGGEFASLRHEGEGANEPDAVELPAGELPAGRHWMIAHWPSRAWRRVKLAIQHPTPVSLSLAVITLGLLLTTMALVAVPVYRQLAARGDSSRPTLRIVARLTDTHNAVWAPGQIGVHQNAFLSAGHSMKLVSGLAEVTYSCGARLVLEGPVEFDLDGPRQGTLRNGKLAVRVSEAAHGFVVATSLAAVRDLGTEFALNAEPNDDVEIIVIEGAVEIKSHETSNPFSPLRLIAGEAVRLSRNVPPSKSAEFSPSKFALRMPVPPATSEWNFDDGNLRDRQNRIHGVAVGRASIEHGQLHLPDGDSCVVLADSAADSLTSDGYTIELWVKPAELAMQNIFVRTDALGPQRSFSHQLLMDSEGHFVHYCFDGHSRWVTSQSRAVPGRWHHVAIAAKSRGAMSIYVDGVREEHWNGELGQLWQQGNRFHIGGSAKTLPRDEIMPGFVGQIDRVSVYDMTLSAASIKALAANPPPVDVEN